MSDLTARPLSRKQIGYATERCKRIAAKKRIDLEDTARQEKLPELKDVDRARMIRDGVVPIDLSRVKLPTKAAFRDSYWHCPSIVECADFSTEEEKIALHNSAIEKRLKKAQAKVDRNSAAILDQFELGEPAEALRLLTEFEAEEFAL